MQEEIKFLRLPQINWLDLNEVDKRAYKNAAYRLGQAQRTMACLAAKSARPDDWKRLNEERRWKIREINEEFKEKCLEIFSETCTRGLD